MLLVKLIGVNKGRDVHWYIDKDKQTAQIIYVTGGRFDQTGPLACLSLFPI